MIGFSRKQAEVRRHLLLREVLQGLQALRVEDEEAEVVAVAEVDEGTMRPRNPKTSALKETFHLVTTMENVSQKNG